MANIAIFEPNKIPQYLQSANTPDYESNPNAIINPDLTSVANVPTHYWKRDGDNIVEMTQAEKDAVNASQLVMRKATADNYNVGMKEMLTALVKVINLRLPNNKITKQEMIDAIKAEIL